MMPLIVGAGPVGLAAAVFLRHQGAKTRIIDAQPQPSINSKALAVNPRSLELLEKIGLAEKLLAAGKQIHGIDIYIDGNIKLRADLTRLPHKYPFMLALSQASTEAILNDELIRLGGSIERGRKLVHCQAAGGEVRAEIENTAIGETENSAHPWLLGADGAHSIVREQLASSFSGSSLANKWYLADVALETNLSDDRAYVFFTEIGFIFMLRVIDPKRLADAPIWRVMGNFAEPLHRLQFAKAVAAPIWQSEFHIGHRLAQSFQRHNIYLAGDGAHIHSPMGARGMNLGIEDAYVFSELYRHNRLAEYARLRQSTDRAVVKKVETLTNIVNSTSGFHKTLRNFALPLIPHLPFLLPLIMKTGTGLDHELSMVS